jgi:uncharacterized protein (TIGR02231 family)
MKKITLLINLISIFSVCASESNLTDVSIMTDRAYVTRQKMVSLSSGAQTIVFAGITPLANQDSFKVRSENGVVKILGLRVNQQFSQIKEQKHLKDLFEKRDQLQKKIGQVLEEAQIPQRDYQMLEELTQHFKDSLALSIHKNQLEGTKIKKVANFIGEKGKLMQGRWKKLFTQFNALYLELEDTNAQIQKKTSVADQQKLDVLVDVEIPSKGSYAIELQYMVPNISWHAVYDLRIKEGRKQASLEMYAMIKQNSGEDWENIRLKINNQRSELNPQIPSIEPYTLSYQEVKEVKTTIASDNLMNEDLAVGAGFGGSENEWQTNFEIKGKHSLGQSMQEKKIFIAQVTLPYREQLTVVPGRYPRAYYQANLINQFSWQLQPGQLSVYNGQALVQQTTLEKVGTGEAFSINAGIDEETRVAFWHHDTIDDRSVMNVMNKKFSRKFFTRLENDSSHKKQLRVLIQIPESEVESVKIDLTDKYKGMTKMEKKPSWWFWDLELAANKNEEVFVNVDVTVPKDFAFSWERL